MEKLKFEWWNKSRITAKYKMQLDLYIALYGENSSVYDILKKGV